MSRAVGSTLTEAGAPEVGAARDAGPLVGEEEKGPKGKELCLKHTPECKHIRAGGRIGTRSIFPY